MQRVAGSIGLPQDEGTVDLGSCDHPTSVQGGQCLLIRRSDRLQLTLVCHQALRKAGHCLSRFTSGLSAQLPALGRTPLSHLVV